MKISMTLQFFCYKHSMLLKKEKKQLCTKKYICRQASDIAATLDAVFFSFRSNCLQMFYKIGVLIDFASHEKHLVKFLFSRTLLRKNFWHQMFSCDFYKMFKKIYYVEHL